MIRTNFGFLVEDKIKELGITITEAASKCGMFQPGFNRIINNKSDFKISTLLTLSRGLNISIEELTKGLEFIEEDE